MNRVLVLGEGARPPTRAGAYEHNLDLRIEGKNPNVRLQIDVFRTKFLRDLSDRLDDLMRVATFVYSADTRVSRGTERDVFAGKWARDFHMVLPVWQPDFWNEPDLKESLADTLQFLTGDNFTFEFRQRTARKLKQGFINFKELVDPLPVVDVVISFSGGSDSLAAVLLALQEGKHPILVSHRPTPPIDTRQRNLVEQLRKRFSAWSLPHISLWANRIKERRAVDHTQRSRSFLYTSASVITAVMLDLNEVRLCDNGIVSINLPQSGQNYGTFLSRSTHPRFLSLAQELMRRITEKRGLTLVNSLLLHTKRDVLETIASSGYPELIQETVSCAHVEGKDQTSAPLRSLYSVHRQAFRQRGWWPNRL